MTRLASLLFTVLLLTFALTSPVLAEDSALTEAEPVVEAVTEPVVDLGIDLERYPVLKLELEAACPAEPTEKTTLAHTIESFLPTTGIEGCSDQQEAACGCPACVVINGIPRCFC